MIPDEMKPTSELEETREAYSKLVQDYHELVMTYRDVYRLMVAQCLYGGELTFNPLTLTPEKLDGYTLEQGTDEDGNIHLRAVPIPKEED